MTTTTAAYDLVVARLEHVTGHPVRNGSARCPVPAHDDRNPSMSVNVGDDGRVLLNCHAGCHLDDILAALNLTRRDLFDRNGHNADRSEITAYPYTDETGTVLFEVVRFNPKGFRQRRPDGHGGWIWKLGDVRRPLYRLPAVIEAVTAGRTVYVAEGEKDVHALERAGVVATCNPGGVGNGKWRPEHTRTLTGANVTVIADRDGPGRRHAQHVADQLRTAGCTVRIVEPITGKDAADHLAAGHGIDDLQPVDGDDPDEAAELNPDDAVDHDDQLDNVEVLDDGHRATDVGNADRLVAAADGHIRYVHAWETWIVHHDGRWHLDTGNALIKEVAKTVARNMFQHAAELTGHDRDDMWKWAKRSESSGAITATVDLARGIPGVIVNHADLDADPWLLNCRNGTVNLRTGRLLDHDPEHLLTKITPVIYDPDAEAPLFEAFLARIVPDTDVRRYLQRFAGYSATGLIREHIFPIWWGEGSNGKSTLIGLICKALGDYSTSTARDLLMTTRHESHDTKYADLFRVRFATRTETKDGGHLDEARVKELTGGDTIKARRMRENYWTFEPTHKLVLATNHRPTIEGTDHAIWRRVHLVPFTEKIVKPELDETLPEKLHAELPGILAWIVRGCLDWQTHGLDVPASVTAATDSYRGESDVTARFMTECGIEVDPGGWERSATLTKLHQAWCDENGIGHHKQWQTTVDRWKQHGARPEIRTHVRGWQGVKAPEPELSRAGVYGGSA